jgi:hypothetical protein
VQRELATVGRRDCSAMADNMGWQAEAVLAALRSAFVEPQPPVTPVLCFLEAEWPLFGAPDEFHGYGWRARARSSAC